MDPALVARFYGSIRGKKRVVTSLLPAPPRNALTQFHCAGCGYGVSVRTAPERCPMCHDSCWEAEASDIEIQARETIALKRRMEELIAQHSGQPLEKVSKDMERDYFMSAEEAVGYGIIDGVLTRRSA